MNQNTRNKTHKFERWKTKEHNRKTKKAIPSKIEKVSKLQTLCREKLFCEDASKTSEKARERWKNFTVQSSLFIGARGGSFKKLPRYDRCEKSGGRVSTPTFWWWRFLPEFKGFRGIGSSESTRFPEGLVLRNSVKALHPRNVGLAKIREIPLGWKVQFGSCGRFC
jgi:hypothetical protein